MYRRAALAALNRAHLSPAVGGSLFFSRCDSVPRVVAALRSQQVAWMSTVDVPPPPTSNHEHTPVKNAQAMIVYTETDEAPALATYSLYPAVAKVRTD